MPKIQSLTVRAVRVPMTEPHRTASGIITESPLVLTDVTADDGTVGHSVVFTYTTVALKPTAELIQNLEPLIKGDILAPVEVEQKLAKRFRLLGTQGLVGVAMAAIDMALWDAMARLHSVSLVTLLGGGAKKIPVYAGIGHDGVGRRCGASRAVGEPRDQGSQSEDRIPDGAAGRRRDPGHAQSGW